LGNFINKNFNCNKNLKQIIHLTILNKFKYTIKKIRDNSNLKFKSKKERDVESVVTTRSQINSYEKLFKELPEDTNVDKICGFLEIFYDLNKKLSKKVFFIYFIYLFHIITIG